MPSVMKQKEGGSSGPSSSHHLSPLPWWSTFANSSSFLKPKSEAIGGLSNLKELPLAYQQVSDSILEGLNSCEKLLTE